MCALARTGGVFLFLYFRFFFFSWGEQGRAAKKEQNGLFFFF